jgi:DNA-binding response OmpR family regulator
MLPRPRIVLIEDDSAISDAIAAILLRAGCQVRVLPDGEAVLDGSLDAPQLFIIDLQLPGVDGLGLCRMIRASETMGSVPVLLLSASAQRERLALEAGADAFLAKPFGMQQLRSEVLRLIGFVIPGT